jgi:anaerobic ribonucleoside-triphosphate reductase activating protein
MNYAKIQKMDIANGLGIRTVIYFCGCKFHCHNCQNKEIWSFNSGKPFDKNAKDIVFEAVSNQHVKGLSILGGEPLQQGEDLFIFLKEFKDKFPDKDVWLWTGYKLSELDEEQMKIISLCDYIVDGQYEENNRDLMLNFRGSSNQIIWERQKDGTFIKSELN